MFSLNSTRLLIFAGHVYGARERAGVSYADERQRRLVDLWIRDAIFQPVCTHVVQFLRSQCVQARACDWRVIYKMSRAMVGLSPKHEHVCLCCMTARRTPGTRLGTK